MPMCSLVRWRDRALRSTVREQHLERAKFHAQFIESRIAKGQRATRPIQYSALATICFKAAQRTAQVDTAETLGAGEDLFRQSNR
jgi:hypothetical protein